MQVRIVIADDHAVMRDGLKMIIEADEELVVVGGAANGGEALRLAEALIPDVVLMDISMPEMNGIIACELIKSRVPSARMIILSMHHTAEYVFRAMKAGASGYLLKDAAGNEVVAAVRSVMAGNFYWGEGVASPPLSKADDPWSASPLHRLSRREQQVMQLVVEGHTSAKIAQRLSLSPKSVDSYRSRVMAKLHLSNIPQLVKFALEHGITPT